VDVINGADNLQNNFAENDWNTVEQVLNIWPDLKFPLTVSYNFAHTGMNNSINDASTAPNIQLL